MKGSEETNYINVPLSLVQDKNKSKKRILIFSYFYCKRGLDDTVGFTVNNIIHWSKLRSNTHKGKINDKYISSLVELMHLGYFIRNPDIEKMTDSNKFYEIQLETAKFDILNKYGIIYFDELERILNFRHEYKVTDKRISSGELLLVLSYLRCYMYKRTAIETKTKPECCYRYNKTISEEIGLSEIYVGKCIRILEMLGIIMTAKTPTYKTDSSWHNGITVFADVRKFRKAKNAIVIDKEYDPNHELEWQLQLLS